MKNLLISAILVAFALTGKAQTSSAEEKILLDIEKQLTEAIASHNGPMLNTVYHDQFRGVMANGTQVDKKKLLAFLKGTAPGTTLSTEEIKTSIYGYAGVTSGKLVIKNKDGVVMDQTRFMHVYIKRNGQWKIIEGQETAVPK